MPSTPVYGLPYPALSDPPNGPSQIGSLATATETALTTVNANANTKAPGHRLVANLQLTSDTGSVTATEVILMSTTFTSLGPSEIYRVEFQGAFYQGSSAVANVVIAYRWRTGNVTLVNTDALMGSSTMFTTAVNATPIPFNGSFIVTGVPAGVATVGIGVRSSNSVAATLNGSATNIRLIRVWDEGV